MSQNKFISSCTLDDTTREAKADRLNYEEIFYSVIQGEIIEGYSTDVPFPSCLIFGRTFKGDPVHSVWAYNKEN